MDDNVIEKYHQQKLDEELKGLFDGIEKTIEEGRFRSEFGTCVKRIPVKPEWKEAFEELEKMGRGLFTEMEALRPKVKRLRHKRHLVWATISLALDDFRNMHYNSKTEKLEIFEHETLEKDQDKK